LKPIGEQPAGLLICYQDISRRNCYEELITEDILHLAN
jgi:hypothetical protein